MIERTILNINNKVYSFLNPNMVTMKETPLSVVEGRFRQCIINPLISFEFACSIAEDIKNHNMGKNSIRGYILSGKNYEIFVTSVDFIRNNVYPMRVIAYYEELI
jgi:hypothetical protein|nr:MAG TPA: hypothetical protein [Caudoviricetes sp.]